MQPLNFHCIAGKETRLQGTTWVFAKKGIYQFSGNTYAKCARVHKGISFVYLGSYMYQQYVYCVLV